MLALAVLGLLAVASPADTAVRVPGTTLRFGLADSAMAARGFTAAGPAARKGLCRFFGLAGDATLSFVDGRLARVELEVSGASPRELDYVHDQLTAMGYRKTCEKSASRSVTCDWTGRTRIRLVTSGEALSATVESAPGPPATAARPLDDDAPRGPALATAGEVPVLPETLAVAIPGRPGRHAPATLLSEARCPYPEAARAAGVQGRVWVLALVDTDGRVLGVEIQSGIPVLDAAALACARGWRFAPVTRDGAPRRFRVLAPVTFTVH